MLNTRRWETQVEIKNYNMKKEEQIQIAEDGLKIIEEVSKEDSRNLPMFDDNNNLKSIKEKKEEFEFILENPEQAAKQKILEAANTVAQIKEVGLDSENPAVANWAEQELGLNSNELGKILKQGKTPKEVQNNVLELMDAPRELLEKSTTNPVKKKV